VAPSDSCMFPVGLFLSTIVDLLSSFICFCLPHSYSQSTYTIFLTFSHLSLSSRGRGPGRSCLHLPSRGRSCWQTFKLTLDLPLLLFVPWLAVRQHYHRLYHRTYQPAYVPSRFRVDPLGNASPHICLTPFRRYWVSHCWDHGRRSRR